MIEYNENISYEIKENGYAIYLDGKLWITQYDQYSKLFVPEGTYEENCLAQLGEITAPVEEQPTDFDLGYEQALADLIEMGVI